MKYLFFIVFGFISLNLMAQGPFFGVKYSKSFTKLKNKYITLESKPDSSVQGYTVSFGDSNGLEAGYYLIDGFAVKAELLFNNHRQKYEGSIKDSVLKDFSSITEMKTVDIPMMAVIGKKVYFEAGVVASLLLKATFISTVSKGIDNITKDYDRLNLGAIIGSGVQLDIKKDVKFHAGGRFFLGLKDFGTGVDALGNPIVNYKTTGWSLGINAGLIILM